MSDIRKEGGALATVIADRLLIERNQSVSERLWRLLFDPNSVDYSPANESRTHDD